MTVHHPLAGIVSDKGDAFGALAVNNHRIEPIGLEAVPFAVELAEMMAVHVHGVGKWGAVGETDHHGAAAFDGE